MRSLLDVSIRSGLLPACMLLSAVACQASKGGSTNHTTGATGQGASSSIGGGPSLGGSLSLNGGTTGVVDTYNGSLTADVGDQITVSGETKDVHLTLKADDGTQVTDGVTWSVDDTKIGSISGDGTFHANGYVGGVVTISATVGDGTISKQITVDVDITVNDGKITDADQGLLAAGGEGDATYKFLYPYDGTVFPRGLAAPVLQLAGTDALGHALPLAVEHELPCRIPDQRRRLRLADDGCIRQRRGDAGPLGRSQTSDLQPHSPDLGGRWRPFLGRRLNGNCSRLLPPQSHECAAR